MNAVLRFPDVRSKAPSLHFTRAEFNRLLNLYSKRVMTGEWRDYAITFGPDKASFFIFRHSMENPLFVISKVETRGRSRGKRFQVSSHGQRLSEGQTLDDALEVFAKPLRLLNLKASHRHT
jgi:hypothetical protein